MPGVKPTFDRGPLTFSATTIANGGNIKGGSLVEPDGTTGRIKTAGANSVKVLGVALGDAAGSDYAASDTTDAWGNVTAAMGHLVPNETAVAYQGVFKLKASAAIAFGELVIAAANGEIAPNGAGTDALRIVGRCVEPGGIASGARGKILLGGVGA
jgi:hypothetical protein